LIAAGEPPRRTLRLDLKKGSRETVEITTEVTTTTGKGTIPGAPIVYTITVEVKEVTADGTAQVQFKVVNVGVAETSTVPPQRVQTMTKSLERLLKDKKGTYSVDSRGIVSTVELDPKPVRDDGLEQLLGRLLYRTSVAVPEEEVGPGAKWTIRRVVQEGRIRIEEVSTVELRKLEGSRLDIALTIERSAPEQPIMTGPGVPAGSSSTLLRLESEGIGAARWDLTKLVPRSFKVESWQERAFFAPGPDGNPETLEVREDRVQIMTRK
jgi:hypothetical protein